MPADDDALALLAASWDADDREPRAERLRRHGLALRQAFADPAQARLAAGGLASDRADAGVMAVRRLALGWAMDEATPGDGSAFAAALDALILGLGGRAVGQPRLLYMRLWTLLSAAREGADLVYSRAGLLPELDRRILLLLFRGRAHVVKDVTALTGVDKAQVSRALKRLAEGGLVERTSVRQPIALTPKGQLLTARLRRMYAAHSQELVLGIDPRTLSRFFDGMDAVATRAVALYEEERGRAGSGERVRDNNLPTDLMTDEDARAVEVIVPRLIALLSYIQRSATLGYKRLLGLSNFEAWVLAEIARQPPIEWSRLVAQVARDESQAARTVRRLVELELVEHQGSPGRRQGQLRPTPAGARAAAVVEEEQWRRDRLLLDPLAPETCRAFLGALDRMTWNVQAQLVRDLAQRASGTGR